MGVFAGFWAVSRSKTRLEINLGGLSGLVAAAGVFGVEVLNVLTMPLSEEEQQAESGKTPGGKIQEAGDSLHIYLLLLYYDGPGPDVPQERRS